MVPRQIPNATFTCKMNWQNHRVPIHLATGASSRRFILLGHECTHTFMGMQKEIKKSAVEFSNRTTTSIANVRFSEFSSWHREFAFTKPMHNDTLLFCSSGPAGSEEPKVSNAEHCKNDCFHKESSWGRIGQMTHMSEMVSSNYPSEITMRKTVGKTRTWDGSHPILGGREPRAPILTCLLFKWKKQQTILLLLLYNSA